MDANEAIERISEVLSDFRYDDEDALIAIADIVRRSRNG